MKKKEHKFQQSVNIHLGAVCAECGDSILAHDHEPPKNPKPLMPNAVDSVVLREQIAEMIKAWSESDKDTGRWIEKNYPNQELTTHTKIYDERVDRVFSLITGETK